MRLATLTSGWVAPVVYDHPRALALLEPAPQEEGEFIVHVGGAVGGIISYIGLGWPPCWRRPWRLWLASANALHATRTAALYQTGWMGGSRGLGQKKIAKKKKKKGKWVV